VTGVGGAAEQALEVVRDGGGDVGGQPGADQVGEDRVAGPAQIDVSDLALCQDADSPGQGQRDAQGPGEVVRGAQRHDAQGHVAVGQAACGFADAAVAAAHDQQVGLQVDRGGEAGAEPAGPAGREGAEEIEPGGVQPGSNGRVEGACAGGTGC